MKGPVSALELTFPEPCTLHFPVPWTSLGQRPLLSALAHHSKYREESEEVSRCRMVWSGVVDARGTSTAPLHTILRVTGDGVQTHHAQVPRLGYLLRIHPAAGATSGQSHPVTRSGRAHKRPHLRIIQPDTAGRIGGS
jgi:hypothetical protein